MLENLKSMDNQRIIQPYKENVKNKMPQLSFKIQKNNTQTRLSMRKQYTGESHHLHCVVQELIAEMCINRNGHLKSI